MTTIPLTEAKKKLLELVRDVEKQGKIYRLTRHGKPAAVIMSEEEYQSIKETLEVMSDPEEVRGILEGLREIEAGEVEDLEDLLERLQG
jgi:prevent-host-death family protein